MDSSNKKVAFVPEVTPGTTPATPSFLIVRDEMTTGNLNAPFGESPERSNDRMLRSTYKQLHTLPKKISMPFAPDAALEGLFQTFMMGTWSTNVLKNGSALQSGTIEEIFEAPTASPGPWLRSKGMASDQFTLDLTNNKDGEITFSMLGMTTGQTIRITEVTPMQGGKLDGWWMRSVVLKYKVVNIG